MLTGIEHIKLTLKIVKSFDYNFYIITLHN